MKKQDFVYMLNKKKSTKKSVRFYCDYCGAFMFGHSLTDVINPHLFFDSMMFGKNHENLFRKCNKCGRENINYKIKFS